MKICLDTSAYSNFLRSRPAVVRVVAHAEWIGIPAIVIGELETGFRRGNQRLQNLAVLDEFLAHRSVEVLSTSRTIAEVYADIHVELTRIGKPIPTNDIWIAATSTVCGATLVTYDKHYGSISLTGKIILS